MKRLFTDASEMIWLSLDNYKFLTLFPDQYKVIYDIYPNNTNNIIYLTLFVVVIDSYFNGFANIRCLDYIT